MRNLMLAALGALLAALPPSPADAGGHPPVYVSSTVLCDYPSIAAAIAAVAPITEIRLVGEEFLLPAGLSVFNRSLRIAGGYPACGAPAATGRSTLRADFNGAPVLSAGGNVPGALNLQLADISIVDGNNPSGNGGGLLVSGQGQVSLSAVHLRANHAQSGGAIHVAGIGGQLDVNLIDDSRVGDDGGFGNTSSLSGGGVSCVNARMRLGWVRIVHNATSGQGGGLRAEGCTILSTNATGPTRIEHNRAREGGGIRALGASSLHLESRPTQKISISHNQAIEGDAPQRGGGLYLSGEDTVLQATGLRIDGNLARSQGGGLMLIGSQAELRRSATACGIGDERCSSLSGNSVRAADGSLAGNGGAAVVFGSGSPLLRLSHTRIAGNSALNDAAINVGNAARLEMDNVLVAGNAGNGRLFTLTQTATLAADFLTLADNSFVGAAINNASSAALALELRRSILTVAAGNSHLQGAGTAAFDCINSGEQIALGGEAHDPGFFAADIGNYRLRSGSSNLDRCIADGNESAFDLAGLPRNIDDPLTPNQPGTLDRGAFEQTEDLFADGLE